MNEARVDDQYYKDVELQNSRAASQKLNEIKKKIKELKKISRSKGYLKKSEQISELLKQLSQETTSTPKNFVKYIRPAANQGIKKGRRVAKIKVN